MKMMFEEFEENLAADTLASAVRFEQSVLEHAVTFRVAEHDVTVSF